MFTRTHGLVNKLKKVYNFVTFAEVYNDGVNFVNKSISSVEWLLNVARLKLDKCTLMSVPPCDADTG